MAIEYHIHVIFIVSIRQCTKICFGVKNNPGRKENYRVLKKNNKLPRFQKSSNILKMRSYNFFFKSVDVQMTKYTYLQYTDFVYTCMY